MSMISELNEYMTELACEIECAFDWAIPKDLHDAYNKVEDKVSEIENTLDDIENDIYKLFRR